MKIFSSFDTHQKQKLFEEKKQQYGENIHLIERSLLFFYLKVFFPAVVAILSWAAVFLLLYWMREITLWRSLSISILVLICFVLFFRIITHYIDYTMDYIIITPIEIIVAEQSWLFKRSIATIDAKQIKSIYAQKWGLVQSIFNNGSMVFLIDAGSSTRRWKITIEYVFNPEKSRTKMDKALTKVQ